MKRFLFFVLIIFDIAAKAISPQPPFEGKSIPELLEMLDNTNAPTRMGAAEAIAWYLNRERFKTNFVAVSLAQQLARKASQLLQGDKDLMVRMASIDLMWSLNTWTNTAPLLVLGAMDNDCMVRVRAISVLHRVCESRQQNLGTNIVNVLIGCLEPSADPGVLSEAAWTAGEIGKEAQMAIPVLERLSKHSDEKVRNYVAEAIHKLRRAANK
jgi:HEAT repeat protein